MHHIVALYFTFEVLISQDENAVEIFQWELLEVSSGGGIATDIHDLQVLQFIIPSS